MELYAKGQLSYLILNCLHERDFYGLDIITEINSRSNGKVNLKKPSVYSNLTRMEKQGYVSSYLKSSDVGPNRKYYSITEAGRKFYQEIDDYYTRNNIDVFSEFSENDQENSNTENQANDEIARNSVNENEIQYNDSPSAEVNDVEDAYGNEDDFFDFSDIEGNDALTSEVDSKDTDDESNHKNDNVDPSQTIATNEESIAYENQNNFENDIESDDSLNDGHFLSKESDESFVEENNSPIKKTSNVISSEDAFTNNTNQTSSYSFSIKNALLSKQQEEIEEDKTKNNISEEKKDDAVFLSKQDANDFNQRLYDISKDINSYKKKRSFAEDQISITAEAPLLSSSNEKRKANLEELKNSILQNRNTYSSSSSSTSENAFSQFSNFRERNERLSSEEESDSYEKNQQSIKDDAKFITYKVEPSSIEKPRKIEPPRLKVLPDSGKEKLPAPKRDSSIDPSHQEILSRLYSRTKGSQSNEEREDCLYDYNDLKDFYKNQNISFDVYQKPSIKSKHNTNKLYLCASIVTFLVMAFSSGILYSILSATHCLNSTFNFFYIVLPVLQLFDICYNAYNATKYKSWLPKQIVPQWEVWTLTLTLSLADVGLNFAFGLAGNSFALYSTTLLMPLLYILTVIPLRYYVKRFLIIKKWK